MNVVYMRKNFICGFAHVNTYASGWNLKEMQQCCLTWVGYIPSIRNGSQTKLCQKNNICWNWLTVVLACSFKDKKDDDKISMLSMCDKNWTVSQTLDLKKKPSGNSPFILKQTCKKQFPGHISVNTWIFMKP